MGSPAVVEGTQTMKILLAGAFLAVLSQPPRPHLRLRPLLRLRLIPGTDTTAMADGDTEATTGLMATTATMERGLLRPSPLLMPLPRLQLIPGMDTTMERGLLRLSLRPLLMLLLRLLLIPGTDTTAMATGLMAMDTTDIGLMAMDTTMERGLL